MPKRQPRISRPMGAAEGEQSARVPPSRGSTPLTQAGRERAHPRVRHHHALARIRARSERLAARQCGEARLGRLAVSLQARRQRHHESDTHALRCNAKRRNTIIRRGSLAVSPLAREWSVTEAERSRDHTGCNRDSDAPKSGLRRLRPQMRPCRMRCQSALPPDRCRCQRPCDAIGHARRHQLCRAV